MFKGSINGARLPNYQPQGRGLPSKFQTTRSSYGAPHPGYVRPTRNYVDPRTRQQFSRPMAQASASLAPSGPIGGTMGAGGSNSGQFGGRIGGAASAPQSSFDLAKMRMMVDGLRR